MNKASKLARAAVIGLVVCALAAALAVSAVALAAGGDRSPSKGPIPEAAFTTTGIDPVLVPDFVQAVGRDGSVVGYIPKDAALSTSRGPLAADGRPTAAIVPVYGADLTTLVGHFYPGRGFVPLGTDPEAVPTITVRVAPGS